ncbi:hypothetical protein I4U23_017137, partial [Adineta vaga]
EEKHDDVDIYSDIKMDDLFEQFDTDERQLNHINNNYCNNYSPISTFYNGNAELNPSNFNEYRDQFLNNHMEKCFNDIDEVVQYLNNDISFV